LTRFEDIQRIDCGLTNKRTKLKHLQFKALDIMSELHILI